MARPGGDTLSGLRRQRLGAHLGSDKLVRYTNIAITKRKKLGDGSLLVWGDITDESLDSDGEIVDPAFAASALTDWFQGGAPVFNQHCEFYPPAGQGISLEMDPEAPAALRAHVVEPTAISHVESGLYKGFSVGWYDPEYVRDPRAPNGRMVGGWAREVSLVDMPANKHATIKGFTVAKSRGKGLPPELFGVVGQRTPEPPGERVHRWSSSTPPPSEGGDNFSRALKAAMIRKGEKALAAAQWYAAFKRDMDPNVGGGVDRDKLEPGDFVLPDEGDGKFPVVTPADVSDAVLSWGRYKGDTSFEEFKSKLTALCKRKGPAFVAELPGSGDVKKGKAAKMDDDKPTTDEKAAGKAARDDIKGLEGDPPEGHKKCPTCKGEGTILAGNRKCPDCDGEGHVANDFKKAKAKAPKGADDPDDAVDDAVDDLMDAVDNVTAAQAADAATDSGQTPENHAVEDDILDLTDAADDLEQDQAADRAADEALDAALKTVGSVLKRRRPVAAKAKQGRDKPDAADKAKGKMPAAFVADEKAKAAQPDAEDDDDAAEKAKAAPPKGDSADDSADDGDDKPDSDGDVDQSDEAPLLKDKKAAKAEHPDGCMCKKCKMKRKAEKAGEAFGGKKAPPFTAADGKGKKKAPKAARFIPDEVLAAHDALCPAYDVEAGPALKALGTDWFATDYRRTADERPSEAESAYRALAAAHRVSMMPIPEFGRIRSAANKALEAAYPDLAAAGHTLRSPDELKRPFLAGANPTTPRGGFAIPEPRMAPPLAASNFDRTGQIANQARPSPSPGKSAADLMGKTAKAEAKALKRKGAAGADPFPDAKPKPPKGARRFYTKAAAGEDSEAMGLLHDHIAKHFPGVCPMNSHEDDSSDKAEDTAEKSEGDLKLAGLDSTPKKPSTEALPEPSGAGTGHLTARAAPGGATTIGKADKAGSEKDATKAARKARELKRLRKANKALLSRQEDFEKRVTAALSKPAADTRRKRGPGANFTPLSDPAEVEQAREDGISRARSAARRLKTQIHARVPGAVEEARDSLPPNLFAAVMDPDSNI
jgi:hypothetical protein